MNLLRGLAIARLPRRLDLLIGTIMMCVQLEEVVLWGVGEDGCEVVDLVDPKTALTEGTRMITEVRTRSMTNRVV